MDTTLGARTVLAASFFTSFMLGMSAISRDRVMDGGTTGIAFVALLLSGLTLERSIRAALRRTLSRGDAAFSGLLVGLPIAFFFLQHETASMLGRPDVAAGSDRVLVFAGVVLIAAAAYGGWRRRRA